MTVKYTNDARTALASGITASATSLTVLSTANFPTLASGDYTYLTLSNPADTVKEIVKCTAICGTTLTVIRGQESTTALAFNSGEHVQLRITAGLLGDAITEGMSGISGDTYNSDPVLTSKVLDSNTLYLTGNYFTIEHGALLTLPHDSELIVETWAAQKQL